MGQSEDRLISQEENCGKKQVMQKEFQTCPAAECVQPTSKGSYLQQNLPLLVFLQSMMLCIMKYLSSQFRSAVPALPILDYVLGENRVRST